MVHIRAREIPTDADEAEVDGASRWGRVTTLSLAATSVMVVWCSVVDGVTRPLDPSSPYDGPVVSAVVIVSGLLLPLLASVSVFGAAGWLHATVWRHSRMMRSNYLRPGVLAFLSLAWTVWLARVPWLGLPFIIATIAVIAVDGRRKRLGRQSELERRLSALRRARRWTIRNQRLTSAVIGLALVATATAIVAGTFFLNRPPTGNTFNTLFAAIALVGAMDAGVWWLFAPALRRRVRLERVACIADMLVILVPANGALVFLVNASLYSFSPEW